MYGIQSVEDRGNGPLQGEQRSQEVLPVAAVKYMEAPFDEIQPD